MTTSAGGNPGRLPGRPGADGRRGGRAGRLYDVLAHRERWMLAAVGLLVLISSALLPMAEIDASFRPFFADSGRDAELTAQFEERFGQSSGAYLVAIVEHDDVTGPEMTAALEGLRDEVAGIDHITQVLTLATHPALEDELLARDGGSTQILARVDLPLADLDGRRPVIDELEAVVADGVPEEAEVRTTGVSVVEAEFADLVLEQLLLSVGILSTVLLIVLYVHFRRLGAVLAVMIAVWLALPVTLAFMAVTGLAITAVSSQVLTIVLIVGVAQGIRSQEQLYRGREQGLDLPDAVRIAFVRLAVPGLATAVTTAVGFFALLSAGIDVIREFAVASGVGVVVVYLFTLALVPAVQRRLHPDRHAGLSSESRVTNVVRRGFQGAVLRAPALVLGVGLVALVGLGAAGIPRLDLDQKFNGELAEGHPIRDNQALLEDQYSGFLGPEVWVRPLDGSEITDEEMLASLRGFVAEVRDLPEVLRVTAVTDFVPREVSGDEALAALDEVRDDPDLAPLVDEVVVPDGSEAAVIVRTTDMGSDRAGSFADDLTAAGDRAFGARAQTDVVGQWWLAQQGMRGLLDDMLASVATASVFVLAILVLTLRSTRFFLLSLLPAVAPIVGAVAVMGLAGIPLRIGTAMILAVALGLIVDDTIYYLNRLKAEDARVDEPAEAVRRLFSHEARAGILSSVVLVAGFATMTVNEMHAIRDMGIVAICTMVIAGAADLAFDPAQYLLASRVGRRRQRRSADGTDPAAAAGGPDAIGAGVRTATDGGGQERQPVR